MRISHRMSPRNGFDSSTRGGVRFCRLRSLHVVVSSSSGRPRAPFIVLAASFSLASASVSAAWPTSGSPAPLSSSSEVVPSSSPPSTSSRGSSRKTPPASQSPTTVPPSHTTKSTWTFRGSRSSLSFPSTIWRASARGA